MGDSLLTLRWLFAAAVLTLGGAVAGRACEGEVARVSIRADVTVDAPERLLDAARIAVGEPLTSADLQRSLRALRATGLAGEVEAYCSTTAAGVNLQFVLRGNTRVSEVLLIGEFGVKRGALWEVIAQRAGEPLYSDRVIRGVYRMQDRLAADGYLEASVRVDVQTDEAAKQAVVSYEITAGPRATIGDVEFAGETAPFDRSQLTARLKQQPETSYRARTLRTEPERLEGWLRKQGYLRAIVGEAEEAYDTARGAVDLTYPIDLGPRIEVRVEGAKLARLRRKGLLPFLEGAGFDDALVVQSRDAIRRDFQKRGYYDVEVTSEQTVQSEGELLLALRVDRGEEWTLDRVALHGQRALEEGDLLQRMQTVPKRFLTRRSGRLVDDTLASDLQNLRSYYALSGFDEAEVGPAAVERPGDRHLTVDIPIVEGPRRRVVDLRFIGVESLEETTLQNEIYLRAGGPFHPLLLDESVNAIRAAYQEEGFAAVGVEPELDWDTESRLVDVVFHVAEGPLTTVEGIILRGNRRTRADVIGRAMDLKSGEPLSARSLLEVQRRLYGLGIFSNVTVDTVPGTPYSSARDVLVSVDEGKRRKVTYGFGYDSEDGVRGLLGYTHNNLFGRAVTARVELQASERDRQARLLVRQPYVGRKRLPVRYSLFRVEEEQDSFDSTRSGLQIEASRRLGSSLWGLLYTFKLVDTELKPPLLDLDRELASVEIASLTPSVFVDRRDDAVNPRRGSTTTVQLEYAFPLLSADSHEFAKLFAQRTAYLPLDRFGTLAASLRFGGIEPIGNNVVDPTLPADAPSRFIPISERFFAGGPSTHRAYRLDRLAIEGDTAIGGADVGGNGLLLLNLDYRFPIAGAVEGTVFYDSGNVWSDWRDIAADEVRHGAGVGLRYLSPIGPLRFEIGWKLDREEGESARELFLSFGHPF